MSANNKNYFHCPHCHQSIVAVTPAKQKRPEYVDWLKLDWSKSNTELAEELKKTVQHVSLRRKTHAPAEWKSHHGKTTTQKRWEAVDWSKTAEQIAQETGKSIMTVLHWRAVIGHTKKN